MYLRASLLVLFFCCLTACEQSSTTREEWQENKVAAADLSAQRAKNPFLAYEHAVTLEVAEEALQSTFDQLISACTGNETGRCTVMQSSVRSGHYGYASIRLRLAPESVAPFMTLLGKSGKITQQSTTAEDLTDVIADTSKRLEMLHSYRDRLQQLEQNPDNNIDSLIKIAAELAEVQTRLEFAQGEKAGLYQRIEQDILNIDLGTKREVGVLSPIGMALDEFIENLSDAIASVITATAYLLPWCLVLLLLFYVLRFIWRKSRGQPAVKEQSPATDRP